MKPISVAICFLAMVYGGLYLSENYTIKTPIKAEEHITQTHIYIESDKTEYQDIGDEWEMFIQYDPFDENGNDKEQDTPNPDYQECAEETESKYYDIPLDEYIQDYIISWCEEHDFDEILVFAVIRCESNYNINCNYRNQDFGLMQININTLDDYGLTMETVFNPILNVECGMTSLLRHYNENNGDLHKTLISYNCGRNGAKKLFKQGICETKYSQKVLNKYNEIKELKK